MYKKLIITAAASLLTLNIATACPDSKHSGKHERCNDEQCDHSKPNKDLSHLLNLDSGRAAELDSMLKSFKAEKKELRKNYHAEMQSLDETHKEKLSGILTAEEITLFEDAKKNRRSKKHKKSHKQCSSKKKGHALTH